MPSDASFEYHPDYSVAEARVKEGNYEEAIIAFQKYMEQFPHEITPHIRIADIQMDHFNNLDGAISELKIALTKAKSADGFSIASFRLADLYLNQRHDSRAAMDCFHDVQRQFPGTRQAAAAFQRAERLIKTKTSEHS